MTDVTAPGQGGPSGGGFDPSALAPRYSRRYLMVRTAVRTGLVVALVAAVCSGLLFTRLFGVDRVAVTGTSVLGPDQVRAAAHVAHGTPLVRVDTAAVAARIRRDPWVASVRVERRWPHGIAIAVVERRAAAIAPTVDHRWAQVSDDGAILGVVDRLPDGLPALLDVITSTPPGSHLDDRAASLAKVAGALPASLAPKVSQIGIASDGVLRLGLRAGTIVVLGTSDDLADKLTAAASVLSHVDAATIGTLDVTSPHLPTSTPRSAGAATTGHGGGGGGSGGTSSPSTNGQGATTTTAKSGKSAASSTTTSTTAATHRTTTTTVPAAQGHSGAG